MTTAKKTSVAALLALAGVKAVEIERFGEVLDAEQFEGEMFMEVEATIEYFEENAQHLSNFDLVVLEMARVHNILHKMRPWPFEAAETLLNLLVKVKNRSIDKILAGARSAIDDVLELLNDEDKIRILEEIPTLLDVTEPLTNAEHKPPSAKKFKKTKAADPSPDTKKQYSPRINNHKIRANEAIHAIRDRNVAAGEPRGIEILPNSCRHLSAKDLLEEVNLTPPHLTMKQITELINRANREIHEARQGRAAGSHVPTGMEWIFTSTRQPNERTEYKRGKRQEKIAARLCMCNKPLDVPGQVTCSSCMEVATARKVIRDANKKAGWTALDKTQLFNNTYARIEPTTHRQLLSFYIAESEKLVGKAYKEIEALQLSKDSRHKTGMTTDEIEKRDCHYKKHSTELKDCLSWSHEDVNVVMMAEVGLAFELRKMFTRGSDNNVSFLGFYLGPYFGDDDDGTLFEGTLYFRYNKV